jgi:hypothetical protein
MHLLKDVCVCCVLCARACVPVTVIADKRPETVAALLGHYGICHDKYKSNHSTGKGCPLHGIMTYNLTLSIPN